MIRKLESTDVDKVMQIWLKTTIEAHEFMPKEYWEKNYDAVKNIYIPMAETFLYDDLDGIKGFISIINNEFIGALFVDDEYQGFGIGKRLINYVVDKYKNLSLAVYKDNKKSVEFYVKRGFSIVEERLNDDSNYSEYIMQNLNSK